jgi:phenylalanine-4-hydroxylase
MTASLSSPSRDTAGIPDYLWPFIAEQDYAAYTWIDHASWRFILRLSMDFFKDHAHPKYRAGLEETGISLDRIPRISEMDAKLRRFGWRAVAVSGFIPPAVFMEFQSLGILPIAAEMRTLEHLAYTPAPDIVHEAAGHAPIIADPEYAAYLKAYGEVARKAIFSSKDMELYDAIRDLSDTKEDPASTAAEIAASQKRLDSVIGSIQYVSEATYLARMNWWTVEYGLVGPLQEPKIYGAGLLSSIGESYHCLSERVRKIPFTLDCVNASYDITRPQPQLFVATDFASLTRLLEQYAETMAFRRGGLEGLAKAQMAATVTTTELDTGVQVGGILSEFLTDDRGAPAYLRFQGPTQLARAGQEIPEQGPAVHSHGFGTPVGLLKDGRSPAELSDAELRLGVLKYASGVEVRGRYLGSVLDPSTGRNQILRYADCTVTFGSRTLFAPEWGVFDLACGAWVRSVFGGAPDRARYLAATGGFGQPPRKVMKSNLTSENRELTELYGKIRMLREECDALGPLEAKARAEAIHARLEEIAQTDWLSRWELLELDVTRQLGVRFRTQLEKRLGEISQLSADRREMIARGLKSLGLSGWQS